MNTNNEPAKIRTIIEKWRQTTGLPPDSKCVYVNDDDLSDLVQASFIAGLEAAKAKVDARCETDAAASEDALHNGDYPTHERLSASCLSLGRCSDTIDQLIKEQQQ